MLPELIHYFAILLDQEGEDVTELNVCWMRRCHTFGSRSVGSRRSSTTSIALTNASTYGLRGYVDTLSLLLLCISMDRSCVCVDFFVFHATFPNTRGLSLSVANNHTLSPHLSSAVEDACVICLHKTHTLLSTFIVCCPCLFHTCTHTFFAHSFYFTHPLSL